MSNVCVGSLVLTFPLSDTINSLLVPPDDLPRTATKPFAVTTSVGLRGLIKAQWVSAKWSSIMTPFKEDF